MLSYVGYLNSSIWSAKAINARSNEVFTMASMGLKLGKLMIWPKGQDASRTQIISIPYFKKVYILISEKYIPHKLIPTKK